MAAGVQPKLVAGFDNDWNAYVDVKQQSIESSIDVQDKFIYKSRNVAIIAGIIAVIAFACLGFTGTSKAIALIPSGIGALGGIACLGSVLALHEFKKERNESTLLVRAALSAKIKDGAKHPNCNVYEELILKVLLSRETADLSSKEHCWNLVVLCYKILNEIIPDAVKPAYPVPAMFISPAVRAYLSEKDLFTEAVPRRNVGSDAILRFYKL